jgi:hypothetical protein
VKLQFFNSLVRQKKLILIDFLLLVLAFCYYLFFVNKGLDLGDEGYYVHFATRIAQGQIPYKDFALQYTPGYFYLLAGLYKIFGFQILVGRYLSVGFCLLILASTLFLLHVYKIKDTFLHLLSSLVIISLGYPLLFIPIVVWVCVFFAVIIQIFFILWLQKGSFKYLLFMSLALSLMLFFKQNLGGYYLILINLIIFLSKKVKLSDKIRNILYLDGFFIIFLFFLFLLVFKNVSYFSTLKVLYYYSKQFTDTYRFTYPPLTMIIQPLGFFKLLPYYFPIIYLCILVWFSLKKKITIEKSSFGFIALTGFFGTVYPASDLLHVYPFLSTVIVSSLILFYKKKGFMFFIVITILFIVLGIYLTFFTKSYRYDDYFLREKTPLSLPRTQGILIDPTNYTFTDLPNVYRFINTYTKKNDYIFTYPFSPVLYFVLDRNNPSGIAQFIILEAPNSVDSQQRVLSEIKEKHVQYIVTVGPYKYNQPISYFIQRQKVVFKTGPYLIFKIDKK